MPVDRSRTPLYIALIVFVMLAFVLAITTYLFFQQRTDAFKQRDAATAERDAAARDKRTADSENERLRNVIGMAKDTADTIEAERNQLFEQQNYREDPRTFVALVTWLDGRIKALQQEKMNLEQEKARIEQEKAQAIEQANKDQQNMAAEVATARQEKAQDSDRLKQELTDREEKMDEIRKAQDEAGARAEQVPALSAGIADLGTFLTNDVRVVAKGRESKDRLKKFEAETSDTERLKFVKEELQSALQVIRSLNAVLNRLRIADPTLQRLISEASPKDERIDGFDGRIVAVDEVDRSVLVTTPSTAGMRPGLIFAVFDSTDPRPELASKKAVIQVVEVEGPTVARARIENDSAERPILSGDGIASSLWSPGVMEEVVIVGYVDFRGSAEDAKAIQRLVERSGARVGEAVSSETSLVVDAGPPRAELLSAGKLKNWKQADQEARKKALEEAKKLDIRVVGLEGLFEMLGLDPVALRANRLPQTGPVAAPAAY